MASEHVKQVQSASESSLIAGNLVHDGHLRTFHVYIPTLYYEKRLPVPLVFLLHGHGYGDGLQMRDSGFEPLADREGFIIVYPDGLTPPLPGERDYNECWARGWNAGHCCWYSNIYEVDDVGFLAALIERLQGEYRLDPQRTFMVGYSNGGMMAYRFAAEKSAMVTAIAPLHATLGGINDGTGTYWQVQPPSRSVPAIIFNAMQDVAVPYFGDQEYLPAQTAVDFWADSLACEKDPVVESGIEDYTKQTFFCAGKPLIQFYSLLFEGHTWPFIPQTQTSLTASQAAGLIYGFFKEFPEKRVPLAPLDFKVERSTMRAWLSAKEVDTLSWKEPIENRDFDIIKYRVLWQETQSSWTVLTEVCAGDSASTDGESRVYRTFNRLIDKNKAYDYRVLAITEDGLQGKVATATVGLSPDS